MKYHNIIKIESPLETELLNFLAEEWDKTIILDSSWGALSVGEAMISLINKDHAREIDLVVYRAWSSALAMLLFAKWKSITVVPSAVLVHHLPSYTPELYMWWSVTPFYKGMIETMEHSLLADVEKRVDKHYPDRPQEEDKAKTFVGDDMKEILSLAICQDINRMKEDLPHKLLQSC